MEVLVPFTTKRLRDTIQGELICIQAAGERSDYGFVLEVFSDSRRRVAILRSGRLPAQLPYWTVAAGDWNCLSFGTDWVMELMMPDPETPSVRSADRYAGGMVSVYNDDVVMQLVRDPENSRTTEASVNLRTFAVAHELIEGSVFVKQWQIWRTAADRDNPRREPLLRFDVQGE